MDQLEQLITGHKIPIGPWAQQIADWLTGNFEWIFDSITAALKVPMEGTVDALLLIPSIVFILLMAALAYYLQRSWRLVAFVVIGFLFVLNQGLWKDMV